MNYIEKEGPFAFVLQGDGWVSPNSVQVVEVTCFINPPSK